MTAEETIASLEAQLKQTLERLDEVTEQLRVAQARIEELEQLKTPPPAFVKANKKNHWRFDISQPHQEERKGLRGWRGRRANAKLRKNGTKVWRAWRTKSQARKSASCKND